MIVISLLVFVLPVIVLFILRYFFPTQIEHFLNTNKSANKKVQVFLTVVCISLIWVWGSTNYREETNRWSLYNFLLFIYSCSLWIFSFSYKIEDDKWTLLLILNALLLLILVFVIAFTEPGVYYRLFG